MACSTESLNRWLFAKNKLKQYSKAAKWQQLNPIICVYNIFKITTTTTNIHSLHTNFILHLYPPYDILPALKTLLYCWHGPATPQTSATRSRSRAASASAFYMQKTLAQLFSFRSFACLYLILGEKKIPNFLTVPLLWKEAFVTFVYVYSGKYSPTTVVPCHTTASTHTLSYPFHI